MITNFDDYSIHQTHEPIAHPSQSDRNFYDRYWFSGSSSKQQLHFECGFGLYPNRFVMDGHFSVVIDGRQHSFHSSCRCPMDRTRTTIGPFAVIVEEPMRRIRLRLDKNDTGIRCDLLFTAVTAPTEEPQNIAFQDDTRLIMKNSRFTQFGQWQGWLEIDGNRTQIVGSDTIGIRDKSWGVRPVGEPETGGKPLKQQEPRVYWIWNPINFGDVCTQFGSFEESDGNPTQLSACITPTYSSVDRIPEFEDGLKEIKNVTHKVQWAEGTRRPISAQIILHESDDISHQIDLQAVGHFYMQGIGYAHPQWTHGAWQGEEKLGSDSWQLDQVKPLDPSFIHVHTVVTATMGNRKGTGILETVVFGPHKPSGFNDFLDGAK